jgi:hypothetical protein
VRFTRGTNLILVHTKRMQAIGDLREVAGRIRARAPDIHVRIVDNAKRNRLTRYWQRLRPSLVLSVSPLQMFRPKGGKVYRGIQPYKLSKSIELQRMREAGLPVPETTQLIPGLRLAGAPWEPYVIVKPAKGRKGMMVRLVRTGDLARRHDELTEGGTVPMLVQQYIDHVDERGCPTGYRVLTFFGKELYASYKCWKEPRRPLEELASDPAGIIANNDASVDVDRALANEEDVLALGREVAKAFPEIPVLGIDIIRETDTGRLHVTETNPSGYVWHFSSAHGEHIFTSEIRRSMYEQFNALDRMADLLIERTRAEAR